MMKPRIDLKKYPYNNYNIEYDPHYGIKILSVVIYENFPKDINIIILDAFPEETLHSIIARPLVSQDEILSMVNRMIDNYFTPDYLHYKVIRRNYQTICHMMIKLLNSILIW